MSSHIEYKIRYRDKVYGYSLGAFIIDVAKLLGSIYSGLSNHEYQSRIKKARSMMQALIVSIPTEILGRDIDLREIEEMDRMELLNLLHSITDSLDRKGLLIRKKVRKVVADEEILS